MIGILVQLLLSWAIIYAYNRGNLSVLGLKPGWRKLYEFGLFLVLASACSAGGFLLRIIFAKEQWVLNPAFSTELLMQGAWWNLKSVLFEEFIFRGVLLFILIDRLGRWRGILISSAAFGVYHWFTQGNWNSPIQLTVIFLVTGVAGILYAYAYAKTKSLYVPVALHFGWNFVQSFVFSSGVIGNGLFVPAQHQPEISVGWLLYFLIFWLPLFLFLVVNFGLLYRMRER
ncbi:MAG: lysostaphin resistance A-like protein [Chitinophagaceae bacterium]